MREPAGGVAGRRVRIDEFLPTYDFHEVHSARIHAPAALVYEAIKTVTPAELWLFVLLMTIRSLSLRFVRLARRPPERAESLLGTFLRSGFVLLADETDREIVLGAAGGFWRSRPSAPAAPRRVTTPQEFVGFSDPDSVKVAANFVVHSTDDTAHLTTETRILATDSSARTRFAWYWRLIRPGSALIRREWLRAIRRRAEQAAS